VLLVVLAAAVVVTVVASVRPHPRPSGLAVAEAVPATTDASSPSSPSSPSPSSSPAPPASPPAGAAALAAAGRIALRWTGTGCPDPREGAFERSSDGGVTWTAGPSPLAVVEHLSLAGPHGLARGYDAACAPAAATSSDAGLTWRAAPITSAARSADVAADGGLWWIGGGTLHGPAAATNGCATNAAGPPSLVSGTTAGVAWLLCQEPSGAGRLLLRTYDGAKTWRRLAGRRPETGLAGTGTVAAMDFLPGDTGWVLLRGAGCAEGELRVTAVAGEGWETLPCIGRSVSSVTEVLAVAFTDPRTALAVALADGRTRLLRSSDGGRAWTLAD
jgi:hypothetical protein